MPLDPRTPVLAGVGQVTHRPVRGDPSTFTEPVALMAQALDRAGTDAAVHGRSALLERLDVLTAVPGFVWSVADPAHAAAERAGLAPRHTRLGYVGATTPQRAVFDAATRILAGELDVAAVVGAEAIRSRQLARDVDGVAPWSDQGPEVAPAPVDFAVPDALSDHERRVGLALPITTYALFEQAIRRERGWDRAEHLAALDALASRCRAVAATVEGAWLRDADPTVPAATPSPTNRMVSLPYTKLLASNVVVDQGAAVVVCSLEAARRCGVPDERLVFPVAGAYAKEQWLVSTRRSLAASLAMRACARSLVGEATPPPEVLSLLDLYSCFPCAVRLAADALGLDPLTDPRPPTVTGGMTFFGGPGNNYVTHALAAMAERLRAAPGTTGLVTANGWYASTHAWGTYSTTPPAAGFAVRDVQGEVDAVALREVDERYEGRALVESYTVGYARDGEPARVVAVLETPAGARRLVATDDAVLASEVVDADPLGATVRVAGDRLSLR